jgi:TDG/mug DNA glycosylase family protein
LIRCLRMAEGLNTITRWAEIGRLVRRHTVATETIMIGGVPVVTLRELLGPSLQAVFVGFNPSPVSVAEGHYYQGPHGRTLWSRLARYGILPNAPKGMEDEYAFHLGFGFADLVRRPTASIKHMSPGELRDAVDSLVERLSVYGKPLVVFTYVGPCKVAGPALERAGHRVLRTPSPYEPRLKACSLMKKLQMALMRPKPRA